MQDADQPLNTSPDYRATHIFSTADVTGTFGGLTQGDVGIGQTPVVDFSATPVVTKSGVNLYPINSEFGYVVTDFVGAVPKDFFLNPEYEEGFVGDLIESGTGAQLGLVISDSPTDTFRTPAVLGTWLAGIGGNTVKASTEHYMVMQEILSDQAFPGDPTALYPLDDDLILIGGTHDGQHVKDVLPLVGDVNGDGVTDIRDVLLPNESTITGNIACGTDYSVTLKDDGKLLYRWGNTIKKPNDVRIEAELALPDEWTEPDAATPALLPLYRITSAELVTRHTITNNPNDQIRPEDYENESATGRTPTYEILADGRWVTTDDYYAGDGTLYPAGTVLRDPALAAAWAASDLAALGATDGAGGFTNAWYTTMDREPFEPVLDAAGTGYDVGPRWRLKSNKYGQDLPSVEIPVDPSLPPPPTKDEVKYEVGEDTQTVINLLDWALPVSPLSISAGWTNNAGTVTANGLNRTMGFDVAFYVKGDQKPATLYGTELLLDYEEIAFDAAGTSVAGTAAADHLVGLGSNTFTGGAGEDLFVLSYATGTNWANLTASVITDFAVGNDTLGLLNLNVTALAFEALVTQTVEGGGLVIRLDGREVARLDGVAAPLDVTDFLLLNTIPDGGATIAGETGDDHLVGNEFANTILGFAGDDILLGLGGSDILVGRRGDDALRGGEGRDILRGGDGADTFLFLATADSLLGATDVIRGFAPGLDRIDLSAIDAVAGTAGDDAFAFAGSAAFSGVAGELRVVSGTERTRILADIDGDRVADLGIRLDAFVALSAADFLL